MMTYDLCGYNKRDKKIKEYWCKWEAISPFIYFVSDRWSRSQADPCQKSLKKSNGCVVAGKRILKNSNLCL